MRRKMKKERPIMMCGEMVCAILSGKKTETRRMAGLKELNKKHDYYFVWKDDFENYHEVVNPNKTIQLKHPYGVAGDTLWVRETFNTAVAYEDHYEPTSKIERGRTVIYKATDSKEPGVLGCEETGEWLWRPSIHMPRWASRITLTVKSVTLGRLHEITDEGAKAEGVTDRAEYERLWKEINGRESWDNNPWVWVVKFEVKDIRK